MTYGSSYVDTSWDPEPTLREAELIEIGTPIIHSSQYEALTVYPTPVQIRIVPWDHDRIRLQVPWAFDNGRNQTITRLELALTRPVINGIANFSDLRLDKIGE